MKQWNLCPPVDYVYNANICFPFYARQMEFYSLVVCSQIWGTLLQLSPSSPWPIQWYFLTAQRQQRSQLQNARITNGKGLEEESLITRKGLCQEHIIHSSPQRFPITPSLPPFPPLIPAAALTVLRSLSQLLLLQWHLQWIHKLPSTCQIHLLCHSSRWGREFRLLLQPVPANPPSCLIRQWGNCCTLSAVAKAGISRQPC